MEKLLTPDQVISFLKVTEKQLITLIKKEALPCVRVGGDIRFKPKEIELWLQRNAADSFREPRALRQIGLPAKDVFENRPVSEPADLPFTYPEPFIIQERGGMLTLTAFNGGTEQHRARILGILAAAGLPGHDENVDHALGFPGAVVELEALPAAFREPFYVFTTHNELDACLFVSPAETFSVSREDILHELSLTNVTHGIDTELLQRLIHPGIPGKLLIIARGVPAASAGKTRIDVHFDTPKSFKPRDIENADNGEDVYRGVSHVARDQLLAEMIVPEGARHGITVTGGSIAPASGGAALKSGPNTYFSHDKRRIHASCDGIAFWKKDAVCVDRALCPAEVGYATGNIEFDGRVIVRGNVASGFTLDAKKKIVVNGQVEAARVVSHGASVDIRAGVRGAGKAVIEASTNITAPFAEGCEMNAGLNINIASSALRCNLSALRSITVSEPGARVVASALTAGQSISVFSAGSQRGEKTVLKIEKLTDDLSQSERRLLEKQVLDIKHQLRALSAKIRSIAARRPQEAATDRKKLEALRKILEKHEQAYFLFRKYCTDSNKVFIDIPGTAYPGVMLMIEDRKLELTRQVTAHRFYYSHGGILKKPLEEA